MDKNRRRIVRKERVQELQEWVEKQIPKWRRREDLDPMPDPSPEFRRYYSRGGTIVNLVGDEIQLYRRPDISE